MLRHGSSRVLRYQRPPRWVAANATRNFHLDKQIVEEHKDLQVPFGFNGLGEMVFNRTYARKLPEGGREQWYQTVNRVVNGTFSLQERWIHKQGMVWDEQLAQTRARDMYSRIFNMKFLPPGRGLWAMGTAVTEDKGLFAALNNCAFVSTIDIAKEFSEPFCFLMDAAMLGVGVGFDTKGAGSIDIVKPNNEDVMTFVVPDSREGWVDSLRLLIESHRRNPDGTIRSRVEFDYSKIRAAGEPIRGFGGESSGPAPLVLLHDSTRQVLESNAGQSLTITSIVDIMNMIGRCVVAGNVRRTAEIAFGDAESDEYISLKDYERNPHRAEYGWTSNNSVFARLGMDYTQVSEKVRLNGEPGFAWLENMQNFGRMNGTQDRSDFRAMGGNPCLEQTLESYELCCLVETFPFKHETKEDYLKTLESAFLYAKTVTLGHTHWNKSNQVMLRNRRIGCSMSGIMQFIAHHGIEELRQWCEDGYNHIQSQDLSVSEEFAIPTSIKTTCIKPSGTVSLLAGATPGMHAPESRFYIRRVRIARNSELVEPLREAGYHVEPAETDIDNTVVVSVPIDAGEGVKTVGDMSLYEQLNLASFLQRHWADNQVSCTVTFDPETEGHQIPAALDYYQYQLKGVSMLPRLPAGAYAQMPYEEISEEEYNSMVQNIHPIDRSSTAQRTTNKDSESTSSRIDVFDLPLSTSTSDGAMDAGHDSQSSQEGIIDEFESLQIDEGVHVGGGGVDGGFALPDSFCDTGFCEMPSLPDMPDMPSLPID